MEGSAGLVHGFGERTQKIGKIVEVITGISQQTNLLALNAAIEAAHAGEYGRGFSVVADEIRKLSEATRRSAEEITALVGEIGRESAKVLVTMESGTLEIREGREVIDTVRGSLETIIEGTVEVARGVGEISALAAEQARGSEEMVKATDEISRIAEDNAAATEELTASLEQMAGSAKELAALADGLRLTASRFRVAARA
jgi:methyl-accepting chemotaxis protein